MLEHQVWAVMPTGTKQELVACYDLDRWQWAEKLGALLKSQGCTDIEIKTSEEAK